MLREGSSETLVRHPDEAVSIRSKVRRLRVFLISIEHLRDRFTFVRSQSSDVHQRLHSRIIHCSDYGACIGVTSKNYWSFRPDQSTFQCHRVIAKGGQRDGGCYDPHPLSFKRENYLFPTRTVGPRTVNRNHRNVSTIHALLP